MQTMLLMHILYTMYYHISSMYMINYLIMVMFQQYLFKTNIHHIYNFHVNNLLLFCFYDLLYFNHDANFLEVLIHSLHILLQLFHLIHSTMSDHARIFHQELYEELKVLP